MKAYTDLGQSKKLAEILPHNSADNTWERVTIVGNNLNVPEEQQYVHDGNMPFCFYSGIGIPCWSLAALLNTVPQIKIRGSKKIGYVVYYNKNITSNRSFDIIDACYEMIIRLHELKML